MIGSLRFAGILIISVWLGAAVFFLAGAGPAAESGSMEHLLGSKNSAYYSGAIAQIIATRLYYLELVCGGLALLHVVAAWLYLGRTPGKPWIGLLGGLVFATLVQTEWLQPKLRQLHLSAHAVNLPVPARENALGSLRGWAKVDLTLELCLITGLAAYLWRMANPSDPPRFVSSVKFRS